MLLIFSGKIHPHHPHHLKLCPRTNQICTSLNVHLKNTILYRQNNFLITLKFYLEGGSLPSLGRLCASVRQLDIALIKGAYKILAKYYHQQQKNLPGIALFYVEKATYNNQKRERRGISDLDCL